MDLNTFKQIENNNPKQKRWGSRFNIQALVALSKRDIKLFPGIGDKNKERFYAEIGTLLTAGVDLQTVLDLSTNNRQEKKDKLRKIYNSITNDMSKGLGLAKAMENTKEFNNFDCYSILIGESTGELATIFNKLSAYYNKKIVQRRKTLSALSYPLIVLCTTVMAVLFMLKFVVPMFANTLQQFGGELPGLTKLVIALSDKIGSYFWLFIAVILTGIIVYKRNADKEPVKRILSAIILKIPYVGVVVKKTHLLYFSQAMELLLAARVSLVESIQLTQKMLTFYPLYNALDAIQQDVMKGSFFYESIAKQTFFDNNMITLIKIGEEVNQLDKMFLQLSKQYEAELEYRSGILVSFLEPLMILLLAVVIGVILISMYLPMFKIGSLIK
jgi:type IV pilus assembly protein PilC